MSNLLVAQTGVAPSAPAAGKVVLYVDTSGHLKVKLPNGSILDAMALEGSFADFTEGTAPANPSAGHARLFVDVADEKLKVVLSDGTIHETGGGGPRIDVDYNAAVDAALSDTSHVAPWATPAQTVDYQDINPWESDITDGGLGYAWIAYDLGFVQLVSKVIIKHAASSGYPFNSDHNTRNFTVEWSDNGSAWTIADTVVGNTAAVTEHTMGLSHRYWRIKITNPNNAVDNNARLNEVKIVVPQSGNLYIDPDRRLQVRVSGDDVLVDLIGTWQYVKIPTGNQADNIVPSGQYIALFGAGDFLVFKAGGVQYTIITDHDVDKKFMVVYSYVGTSIVIAPAGNKLFVAEDPDITRERDFNWNQPSGPLGTGQDGTYQVEVGIEVTFAAGYTTGAFHIDSILTSGTIRDVIKNVSVSGPASSTKLLTHIFTFYNDSTVGFSLDLVNGTNANVTVKKATIFVRRL